MPNRVLVHSCFPALFPVALKADGPSEFHEFLNSRCACRYYISYADRDERVRQGEAFIILRFNSNGYKYAEQREIVLARKMAGPPWVEPLRESTIDAAVAGKPNAIKHLNTYGSLARFAGVAAWRKDVLEKVDAATQNPEARGVIAVAIQVAKAEGGAA